jgi:hypothetical protein
MYQNATREQIENALRAGQSVTAISRELRADRARIRRIRDDLGLATFVRTEQTRTLEEKWAESTRPLDDGHVEWTGSRGNTSGTPVMRHRDKSHSPAAVAFRIRTGRDGKGHVFADCGMQHCIAPEHVKDETERIADREALRSEAAPQACRYGHDRATHGRFEPDGTSYCARCNWLAKNPDQDDRARRPVPQSPEEAFRLHTQETDDGHVLWTGPNYRRGPGLPWRGTTLSPARIAFRLHHGRDPEGNVTAACTVPLCVAGPCLQDKPMRQKADKLFKSIFGTAA